MIFGLACVSTLLGFAVSAAAADSADRPALDCLLEPYEVVEVSSALEGVIKQIHVDRNDEVSRGQLLVELDSDVEKSQVELARTRASLRTNIELRATELAFHERNLGRLQELYNSDTISLHVKDQADTDASKSRLQLRNAKESQRLAQLELAKAEAILALRSMHSPIDGVVVARNKVAGEFVEDQSILSLARLDPLKVEVIVPVEFFGTIKEGMQVEVMPENFGDAAHKATVTLVDKVIDPASGTFDVRAELPNPDYNIPSGLHCTALFLDKPTESSSIAAVAAESANTEPKPEPSITPEVTQDHAPMREQASVPTPATVLAAARIPETVSVPAAANVPAAVSLPATVSVPTTLNTCSATRESVVHNYKVFADPRANNTVTGDLVNQLLSRGVHELYVLTGGKNKGQVALGMYRQKQYAEERLEELAELGFQARISTSTKKQAAPACTEGQQFAKKTTERSPIAECSFSPDDIVRKYRVIADPRANDSATYELVKRLHAGGINELYVIADGEYRGQVALGLYRKRHYAEERLAEVASLGFHVKMSVSPEIETASACSERPQFAVADF
jgi:RND family efflux transporter MFP subunit